MLHVKSVERPIEQTAIKGCVLAVKDKNYLEKN